MLNTKGNFFSNCKKVFFIKFIFSALLILSNNAHSDQTLADFEQNLQNEEQIECGVTEFDGEPIVAPRSFSICKEDITYNSLYYLFAPIFEENEILTNILYEDEVTTGIEANISGIAGPVMTILNATTYLIFVIGSIVLSYVTIKYLLRTASTGEFGGNWHSFWIPVRSLLAILLIAPIGGVSIAQVIVLLSALVAAALGNYLWGAFLNQFQMDYIVPGSSPDENENLGYSQAQSLVETQLCTDRSRKAARKEAFLETDGRETKWLFVDADYQLSDHLTLLLNCSEEGVEFSADDHHFNAGQVTNISLGNAAFCSETGPTFSWFNFDDYEEDIYGEKFSCGGVSFNQVSAEDVIDNPASLEVIEDNLSSVGGGISDCDNVSPGQGMEGRRAACEKRQGEVPENSVDYSAVEDLVDGALNSVNHVDVISNLEQISADYLSANESIDYQSTEVEQEIENLSATLKNGAGPLFQDLQLQGGEAAASKGLFVAYNTILTNLLGSKMSEPSSDGHVEKTLMMGEEDYLFKRLLKNTKEASENLQKIHCTNLFEDKYSDFRENQEAMSPVVVGSDILFSDWRDEYNLQDIETECMGYRIADGGNVVQEDNFYLTPSMILYGSDIDSQMDVVDLYNNYDPNEATWEGIFDTVNNSVREEALLNAEINTQALSLWFYVAREATARSYAEIVKENLDRDDPINMRKRGFASAGGYLLNIAMSQLKVSDLVDQMKNSVSWSSYLDDENSYMYSSNFDPSKRSVQELNSEGVNFARMDISGFFSALMKSPEQIKRINDRMSSEDELDSESARDFMSYLEDFIFAPTKYLKESAGIPRDMTLREGIQRCYYEGECSTGSTHPVNALIYMGNDLVSISMTMLLITVAVDFINSATSGSGSSGGSMMERITGLFQSAMTFFLSFLDALITVASVILNFLTPFWWLLLMAGLFLSYIMPTIPFVAFLLVFIGWVILVIELLIAVPIWLLMMAVPDDNGAGRANGMEIWNFFGQLILKPAFMVIAVAFAWFLASASVFIVNMTVFSVFANIEENTTGTIMGLMNIMFFYVIYTFVVFIALIQAFKLISSLPDEMSKWINVRQGGDSNTVNSIGADRTMQLILLSKVQQASEQGISGAGKALKETQQRGRQAKQYDGLRTQMAKIKELEESKAQGAKNNTSYDKMDTSSTADRDQTSNIVKDAISDENDSDNKDKSRNNGLGTTGVSDADKSENDESDSGTDLSNLKDEESENNKGDNKKDEESENNKGDNKKDE